MEPLKKYIKTLIRESLNENRFTDAALDKIKRVGGFTFLPDIDKLALLGKMKDSEEKIKKLKRLNLRDIYKENGGTFGRLMIKVRVKPVSEQPIDHRFSKEQAGKEGWLYPGIHYSDNDPYVTVRFDEFTPDVNLKGGGRYDEFPIMLANIYPIDYDEVKSDFTNYDQKIEFDRKEFLDSWKDFLGDTDF